MLSPFYPSGIKNGTEYKYFQGIVSRSKLNVWWHNSILHQMAVTLSVLLVNENGQRRCTVQYRINHTVTLIRWSDTQCIRIQRSNSWTFKIIIIKKKQYSHKNKVESSNVKMYRAQKKGKV